MGGEDSLTDGDDSLLDVYSTRKILSTYNSVLEKLKSSTGQETKDEPSKTNVEVEEVLSDCSNITDDDYNPSPKKSGTPVKVTEIVVADDPPDISVTGRRRSNRLKQKGRVVYNVDSSRVTVQAQPRSNARSRKHKRKKDVEVVDISESNEEDNLNTSVNDEMNYTVSVKVLWKSVNMKSFPLRRFQKLQEIYEYFMKEENVPFERILLTLRDKKISPNDTPESLDLKVYEFIEGGILSGLTRAPNSVISEKCTYDENCVTLKLQDVQKRVLKFSVQKDEPLKLTMIRYAEQIEKPLKDVKFYFEGEILRPTDTPESLGLENDEIIDVKIH